MRRALLLLSLAISPLPAAAQTLQSEIRAFQQPAILAARDRPQAEAEPAFQEAAARLAAIEALFDPRGAAPGGLAELNRAAGRGRVSIAPELALMLDRALRFCTWASGAHGPLGGGLDRLWGFRYPAPAELAPPGFDGALAAATCDHLQVDAAAATAELAAGSELSLGSYAIGFGIDRAVEILRARGVENGFVAVGNVERAFGPGPAGDGWPITPPRVSGIPATLPDLWLRDEAVALASRDDARPADPMARLYLDHRKGRAPETVLAVIAASTLAVDAQALAGTLFATGSREGQMRLGSLQPRPAALWVLGGGESDPLMVEYQFTRLRRAAGAARPSKNRP